MDTTVTLEQMLHVASDADATTLQRLRKRGNLIALCDFCADHPEHWQALRLQYFCPELTHYKIAALLNVARVTVTRYLKGIRLTEAECSLPITEYQEAVWQVLSLRRLIAAGDHCAEHPKEWRITRLHFFCPSMSITSIAGILDISESEVARVLHGIYINEDIYESLPPIGE